MLERLGECCTVGVLDGLGQDICEGSLCSYLLHHKADLLLSPTEFHTDADEQIQCKMAARGKEHKHRKQHPNSWVMWIPE